MLDEAKKVWPQAEYYLAVSTLNLMSGPHHDAKHAANYDGVIAAVQLKHTDGGDW